MRSRRGRGRSVRVALVAAALLAAPAAGGVTDGLFVHAYTGVGVTEPSDLRISVPAQGFDVVFEQVDWEDHSLSRPSIPYIGVRVGKWLSRRPWLGVAADVVHYKVFAETARLVRVRGTLGGGTIAGTVPLGQLVRQYDVANGVNLWLGELLVRKRMGRDAGQPDGRWWPYAGVGAGPAVLYTHSQVLGENRKGYELGRLAVELLAGVELRLGSRWRLIVEAKRTRTTANGSVAGGDSRTTLDSDHLVVGGGFRF